MKILAVGAHLDDIEIACGGTLAKAIENGHQVKVLIMSKSGYTNKDGVVQRENDVAIEEGTNALHILGIQKIEILDFPTKDIPWRSDVVNAIDVCISDYNPDVIFKHMLVYQMRLLQQREEEILCFFMSQLHLQEDLMLHLKQICMLILKKP